MKNQGELKEMICPHCGKAMLFHQREVSNWRDNHYLFLRHKTRYPQKKFVDEFRCEDCPYIYPFSWLNDLRMDQYEFLTLRKGENRNEWSKRIRKSDESQDAWLIRREKMANEYRKLKEEQQDGIYFFL